MAPAQVLLAELLSLPSAELEHRIAAELGCEPGARARTVAAHLLADTDDLGVLTEPVPGIAARLGVAVGVLHEIITILRTESGHAGLCAASLADRLRLEVRGFAERGRVPDEVERLIRGGLDQLGGSTPDAVGLTSGELAQALAWLRGHLTAEVFGEDRPAPPAPVDIVVRHAAGELVVAVVPGPWSAVHVAESTVRRQARRVVAGPSAHLPLTRREIAAELAVHESTVSGYSRRIPSWVRRRCKPSYRYPVNGAVGLVGNLICESGVQPDRIEGSRSATPMRAPNFAGRVRDFTPEEVRDRDFARKQGPRLPGIGIAQWTDPTRRAGLFTHTIGESAPRSLPISMPRWTIS